MRRVWTEEMDDALRRMRDEGASYSEIAKTLNVSRGSAIGRGSRIGSVKKTCRACGTARSRYTAEQRALLQEQRMARAEAKRAAALANEPHPIGPVRDFPAQGLCRWPHGNTNGSTWRMCGHPSTSGVYCDHHHERALAPRQPNKAAA